MILVVGLAAMCCSSIAVVVGYFLLNPDEWKRLTGQATSQVSDPGAISQPETDTTDPNAATVAAANDVDAGDQGDVDAGDGEGDGGLDPAGAGGPIAQQTDKQKPTANNVLAKACVWLPFTNSFARVSDVIKKTFKKVDRKECKGFVVASITTERIVTLWQGSNYLHADSKNTLTTLVKPLVSTRFSFVKSPYSLERGGVYIKVGAKYLTANTSTNTIDLTTTAGNKSVWYVFPVRGGGIFLMCGNRVVAMNGRAISLKKISRKTAIDKSWVFQFK